MKGKDLSELVKGDNTLLESEKEDLLELLDRLSAVEIDEFKLYDELKNHAKFFKLLSVTKNEWFEYICRVANTWEIGEKLIVDGVDFDRTYIISDFGNSKINEYENKE